MATVYFYKLRLFEEEKKSIKNNADAYNKDYKTKEELERLLKQIISQKGIVFPNNKNKCIPIDDAPEWVLLEVLKMDKIQNFRTGLEECDIKDAQYIFGRIGKKKDITNIQRRNFKTFVPQDIKKDPEEDIEVYTYFYLFFDTSVIVYLGAQSAPGIHKINDMFIKHTNKPHLKTEIIPITAENMVEIISHKDIVNSFEITTTLPSDEIINIDSIGLSESTFDKLRDERNIKITVAISADGRNKSVFKESKSINHVVEDILNSIGGNRKKLKVKAKNNNECVQEYDMIEKMFTRSIKFKYKASEGAERRIEIEEKLFDLYYENRRDIVKYCKD